MKKSLLFIFLFLTALQNIDVFAMERGSENEPNQRQGQKRSKSSVLKSKLPDKRKKTERILKIKYDPYQASPKSPVYMAFNVNIKHFDYDTKILKKFAERVGGACENQIKFNEYRKLLTAWKDAISSPRLQNCFFHECRGSHNDFSIKNELLPLAKQLNLKLTQELAPRLFALIQKLLTAYNLHKCTDVILTEGTSADYCAHEQSKDAPWHLELGFNLLNILTDDELECIIAHELTHAKLNHIATDETVNTILDTPELSLTEKERRTFYQCFNRILEREADTLALQTTQKTDAFVTALLKIRRLTLIRQAEATKLDPSFKQSVCTTGHPTMHERICFALSL